MKCVYSYAFTIEKINRRFHLELYDTREQADDWMPLNIIDNIAVVNSVIKIVKKYSAGDFKLRCCQNEGYEYKYYLMTLEIRHIMDVVFYSKTRQKHYMRFKKEDSFSEKVSI